MSNGSDVSAEQLPPLDPDKGRGCTHYAITATSVLTALRKLANLYYERFGKRPHVVACSRQLHTGLLAELGGDALIDSRFLYVTLAGGQALVSLEPNLPDNEAYAFSGVTEPALLATIVIGYPRKEADHEQV